jgi:hypothetical protein
MCLNVEKGKTLLIIFFSYDNEFPRLTVRNSSWSESSNFTALKSIYGNKRHEDIYSIRNKTLKIA